MLFMIANPTCTDLKPEQYAAFGQFAQEFYENTLASMPVSRDRAITHPHCTFALTQVEDFTDPALGQAPFRPFADLEVVAVERVTGGGPH